MAKAKPTKREKRATSKYVILFYSEGTIDGVRTENSRKEGWDLCQKYLDDENTEGEVELWGFGMGLIASSDRGDFS